MHGEQGQQAGGHDREREEFQFIGVEGDENDVGERNRWSELLSSGRERATVALDGGRGETGAGVRAGQKSQGLITRST
jgi:hypothetical protein